MKSLLFDLISSLKGYIEKYGRLRATAYYRMNKRLIFNLKFGQYRNVEPLVDEHFESELIPSGSRVLTDFTGNSYRLIIETSFASLAEYENYLEEAFAAPEWKEWYAKFMPHIRSSHREILKQIK